jgi:hypothetical protein
MLSYSNIVKKAFRITLAHPLLWCFGLFVVGGFNLNFLHYQNVPLRQMIFHPRLLEVAVFFQNHPGFLALASFAVLIGSLLGLVVTNWSRVMLVDLGESVVKIGELKLGEQLKKSRQPLFTVIKVSLLTTSLMLLVAAALFLPPLFLGIDASSKILLWEVSSVIFLPLAFTISCVNIFTTFYAVLYKKSWGAALNLGTDFFASRWTQILGLVAVLVVIYCGSFIVGVSLIYAARLALRLVFLELFQFNLLSLSAMMMALKAVSNLLLWLLLAGLSVFFNQALLILFLELNAPLESEALAKERKIVPVTSV